MAAKRKSSQLTRVPPSTAERAAIIMELMRTGKWVRGKTLKQLATEWGTSHQAVRAASANAVQMLSLSLADREERATQWYAQLEHDKALMRELGQYKELAQFTALEGKALHLLDTARLPTGNEGDSELRDPDDQTRAAALIANPGVNMTSVLRMALANPSTKLLRVLDDAGFVRVVEATGEEK